MSVAITKRRKELSKLAENGKKSCDLKEALGILRAAPKTKFDQSVELQFKLGVDLTASDQVVRGTAVLPHGQGKPVRVIVFSKDENAKAAKEAGADLVGGEELIEKILGGWMEFDVAVSVPAMMKEVGKLGKVLGPRGLMPSPKAGTVTDNPAKAVKEVKGGRIEFKMDKFANVNTAIGRLSFSDEALVQNAEVLIGALVKAKPRTLKGVFVKSAYLSSTMGPGVRLDLSKFLKAEEAAE
ncbi:MAG: 50S ribosomal protein L1 [Candidatus Omnitrophica bacterium]|nr:50S ribosomal protein L1 [Candidatus Omnitrophota bacterium]